jgi:hypothetical protein
VADRAKVENAPDAVHNVVRRETGGFVDNEDAIHENVLIADWATEVHAAFRARSDQFGQFRIRAPRNLRLR